VFVKAKKLDRNTVQKIRQCGPPAGLRKTGMNFAFYLIKKWKERRQRRYLVMGDLSHQSSTKSQTFSRGVRIKTTLYEVIDAVGNAVDGKEEKLIPGIVLHLVNSGKIKFTESNPKIVTG
jgi:hypothetical protein